METNQSKQEPVRAVITSIATITVLAAPNLLILLTLDQPASLQGLKIVLSLAQSGLKIAKSYRKSIQLILLQCNAFNSFIGIV